MTSTVIKKTDTMSEVRNLLRKQEDIKAKIINLQMEAQSIQEQLTYKLIDYPEFLTVNHSRLRTYLRQNRNILPKIA